MRKKLLTCMTAAMVCVMPLSAQAAEAINSVSLSFDAENFDDDGVPEIEVEAKGSTYDVGEAMLASEYYSGDEANESKYEGDHQTYVVELSADDDHYFNITKSSKINLNGAGAEFVRASRKDNGTTLIITVKLTRLNTFLGEIPEAGWREDGVAQWEPAVGAVAYQVSFRDSKGKLKRVETGGTRYDCRPFMQKEGTYSYEVKPISIEDKKGERVDGGSIEISEEAAASNKSLFEVEYEQFYEGELKGPGTTRTEYKNIGWQKDDNGKYWYRNPDASYIQTNWLQDGGNWYFFDADGWLVVDDYASWKNKDYYFGPEGKLQTNGKAPDGRKIEEDGALEGISKYGVDSDELSRGAFGPGMEKH